MSDQLNQRMGCDPSEVELFIFDVDGVLTDGSININDDGSETKRFSVRDGYGFRLWLNAGFKIAIITGRSGKALIHRLVSLGIDEDLIFQGSSDKRVELYRVIKASGVDADKMAYMGDDWPDLPALARVGFPACPADAEPEVKSACAFVASKGGGQGAAREAIAHILHLKGLYSPK